MLRDRVKELEVENRILQYVRCLSLSRLLSHYTISHTNDWFMESISSRNGPAGAAPFSLDLAGSIEKIISPNCADYPKVLYWTKDGFLKFDAESMHIDVHGQSATSLHHTEHYICHEDGTVITKGLGEQIRAHM